MAFSHTPRQRILPNLASLYLSYMHPWHITFSDALSDNQPRPKREDPRYNRSSRDKKVALRSSSLFVLHCSNAHCSPKSLLTVSNSRKEKREEEAARMLPAVAIPAIVLAGQNFVLDILAGYVVLQMPCWIPPFYIFIAHRTAQTILAIAAIILLFLLQNTDHGITVPRVAIQFEGAVEVSLYLPGYPHLALLKCCDDSCCTYINQFDTVSVHPVGYCAANLSCLLSGLFPRSRPLA